MAKPKKAAAEVDINTDVVEAPITVTLIEGLEEALVITEAAAPIGQAIAEALGAYLLGEDEASVTIAKGDRKLCVGKHVGGVDALVERFKANGF